MMPFPGGIESAANATLLFSLVAALIYGADSLAGKVAPTYPYL